MNGLYLSNITKSFSLRGAKSINVLNNLDLNLEFGKTLVLFGSNGSGKSTLLNIIRGDVIQNMGDIQFNNISFTNLPSFKRSQYIFDIRQKSGENLCETLTLLETYSLTISNPNSFFLKNKRHLKNNLEKILESYELGLEKLVNNQIKSLSGGEYQIFNMILLQERIEKYQLPCLLLLDEHLAHLDPSSAAKVFEITTQICKKEYVTSIMVSHNVPKSITIADNIMILKDGSLKEINVNDKDLLRNINLELFNGSSSII